MSSSIQKNEPDRELQAIAARMRTLVNKPVPTSLRQQDVPSIIEHASSLRHVHPPISQQKFDFSQKKLIVLCKHQHDYENFCRFWHYTPQNTISITHGRFRLALGMSNGYYTILDGFVEHTDKRELSDILCTLQSHGFQYVPLQNL